MEKRADITFICLTPVRNEEWILPTFLELNSVWADHIVILDQCSTDSTPLIAKQHPKVRYFENKNPKFDELYRQIFLYEKAREIPTKKAIIFFLDADEYIPPSQIGSEEWEHIKKLEEGTRIYTRWIQVLPGLSTHFRLQNQNAFGYVDDQKDISGSTIHNERVPKSSKNYHCKDVVNIHLGYTPIVRNYKKHTWYILWEHLNRKLRPIELNTNYRKFIGETSTEFVSKIEDNWIPETLIGTDLDIEPSTITWWDKAIIGWLKEHDEKEFRKLDIWDFDWNMVADELGENLSIRDPRSPIDKAIIRYMATNKHSKKSILFRSLDLLLKHLWK